MRIICPNCATSYELNDEKLGPEGRAVRCSQCRETWVARRPTLPAEMELAVAEGVRFLGRAGAQHAPNERRPPAARPSAEDNPSALPVGDAPPLAPAETIVEFEPMTAADEPDPSEDIESVAARRDRPASKRRSGRRPRPLALVIFGCLSVLLALLMLRTEVVRFAPQTARLYELLGIPVNLRGLAFQDLRISGETKDDVPVLVVEGRIVNVAGHNVEVPRLRFAVRNKAGVEVYAWTALPDRPVLGAGESLPFRSRLASPPEDAKDVLVRFFNRRDLVGGE